RAYTKHAEYGAVIQDPDICFGCGYCTWVCPYNAPQLDPVKGHVEKCNMCVDRLEVGLKPACVSACVGNALDFGVIENTPQGRDDIETTIPGFPSPDITHPNIRFESKNDMGEEVTRTDSMPLKYKKDVSGHYQPEVDAKDGLERFWNMKRLSSSENPLVLFTLMVQASLGIFFSLVLGSWFGVDVIGEAVRSALYLPMIVVSLGLSALGLLMSVTHLGKPFRFYRGFNNWRHSPVCREGLGVTGFLGFGGLHVLSLLPAHPWMPDFILSLLGINSAVINVFSWFTVPSAVLALVSGAIGLYYMYCCYRIKARPFWDHISTACSFVGNGLSLGGLTIALVFSAFFAYLGLDWSALISTTIAICLVGISLEGIGLWIQARDLNGAHHEGAASHYIQKTTFGYTYQLRNNMIALNFLLAGVVVAGVLPAVLHVLALLVLAAGIMATALIGRALFYVLVVPTTMPGAFFWRNKGFVEHARDIGMDHMPNSGVVPARH
ncbi:MAG: dimethyl sulfoxide reductase anchor subunit, partial [Spongiibacteraceae bacterium]|nr:dimethyl sulfoxide reductase anchor subunit [Spongiibacteraceae bacterium]